MKNIIFLYGQNYDEDKKLIESNIKPDSIFLFKDPKTEIYQYIDYLHDECGLKTKVLNKLRICREISFDKNVTLLSGEGVELDQPASMQELLQQLQPGTYFRLVIENDNRSLLADILQQLIYIDYPITEIDLKLRREYNDAAKSALFMKHIQTLQVTAKSAVDKLSKLCIDDSKADEETRAKLYQNRAQALASYSKICEQIDKALDVEMKVAVAASKKTGKSVIVNCMLGTELAPTSLEMATPNTCIYRRSPDNHYHLSMVNEATDSSTVEHFDTADQLHKRIQEKFKKAQDDSENKFTIPDMEISYVSNGNNFESYTIYDTPGPDLAGAEHAQHAEAALDECDVAIFAIDYTKYLTTTEENFLRDVKSVFKEKNKFHTLIFVINKIDEALSDKGTKSRVKSIDFIRNRLRKLDEEYSDCIVFATSAQDYFYTLELENAAKRLEPLSHLQDHAVDLYQEIRPTMNALSNDGYDDEELDCLLSNLDGEVGRIKMQLGYPKVDMVALRHYSGIPQLMDYVSYIAKSKAREEIVNSITYTIAAQCNELQALIDQVSNVEILMNKTQEDIDRISAILKSYLEEIGDILNKDLTEEDFRRLNSRNLLAAQIRAWQGQSGHDKFPVELSAVLQEMRKGIADIRESQMQREIWEDFVPVYLNKIKKLVGQTVSVETLDLTVEESNNIIGAYLKRVTDKRTEDETKNINGLREDLQNVAKERLRRIAECSEQCKRQLEKENCPLQLPEMPLFDVSIPKVELINKCSVREKMRMSSQFADHYKEITGWKKFLRNVFVHGDIQYAKKEVKVTKALSEKDLNKIHKDFSDMLTDENIYGDVRKVLEELADNVALAEKDMLKHFKEMNDTCTATIEIFKQVLDDRSYYEDRLADYARMKELISNIQAASKDFLDTWALVVGSK